MIIVKVTDLSVMLDAQWDKVEDKYAVSTVAGAGVVALWGTAGMMSVGNFKC